MNSTTPASPIGKVLVVLAVLLATGGSVYFAMNPGKSLPPGAKPANGNTSDSKPADAKPLESKPEEQPVQQPSQQTEQPSETQGKDQPPAK